MRPTRLPSTIRACGQTRARQDHRGEPRVGDVDRDAGRHELHLTRRQRQRRVDARAKIHSGGPGVAYAGRPRDALVQHLERDARRFPRHFLRPLLARSAGRRRAISATKRRASASLSIRGSGCAPCIVDQRHLVVVAAQRVLRPIGDDQRHLLAPSLLLRVPLDVVALRGEADAVRRVRRAATVPGCRRWAPARSSARRRFLDLARRDFAGV